MMTTTTMTAAVMTAAATTAVTASVATPFAIGKVRHQQRRCEDNGSNSQSRILTWYVPS